MHIEAPYLGRHHCAGWIVSGWCMQPTAVPALLPRDADQQYLSSQPVAGPPAPGDLVFATEDRMWPHVSCVRPEVSPYLQSLRECGITSLNSPFYRDTCWVGIAVGQIVAALVHGGI